MRSTEVSARYLSLFSFRIYRYGRWRKVFQNYEIVKIVCFLIGHDGGWWRRYSRESSNFLKRSFPRYFTFNNDRRRKRRKNSFDTALSAKYPSPLLDAVKSIWYRGWIEEFVNWQKTLEKCYRPGCYLYFNDFPVWISRGNNRRREKTKVSRTLAEALISSRLHRPRPDPLGASLPSNWNPRERWEKENRRKVPYLIFHIGGAAWIFLRVCKASRKRYPATESFFPSRAGARLLSSREKQGIESSCSQSESSPSSFYLEPNNGDFSLENPPWSPSEKKNYPDKSRVRCKYNFNYEASHIATEMQRYYVIEFE